MSARYPEDKFDDALDLGWEEVWVLVMDSTVSPEGRVWFKRWTVVGPAHTVEEHEAASFPSEQAAMMSPAYSFWGTSYKPERLAP